MSSSEKKSFKKGDIVLLTKSFGSGLDYVGQLGIYDEFDPLDTDAHIHGCKHIVKPLSSNYRKYFDVAEPTELIKALY